MKKALLDYQEWRSFKVPVRQALRLTWRYNVTLKTAKTQVKDELMTPLSNVFIQVSVALETKSLFI